MNKNWFDKAWDDYLYWQSQLIKDAERDPFSGIGKPEPLKGDLSGFWSRRIDDTNRLVYRVNGNLLEILSCRGHYE